MASIVPPSSKWKERSRQPSLGYYHAWEMLSEKFHTTPKFLKRLNPGLTSIQTGSRLTVPNPKASTPLPPIANIKILLSQTSLLTYDQRGRLTGCFPCSIAANKNKRPSGALTVINFAKNPNYTFDPALLTTIAQKENITTKMILPPGPNNPVGIAWIGLSLPGYGIHGTPSPSLISASGSSGCFRLANWNANKLLHAVSVGTPVHVLP